MGVYSGGNVGVYSGVLIICKFCLLLCVFVKFAVGFDVFFCNFNAIQFFLRVCNDLTDYFMFLYIFI